MPDHVSESASNLIVASIDQSTGANRALTGEKTCFPLEQKGFVAGLSQLGSSFAAKQPNSGHLV
jgi:hypothetical protein